MKRPNKQVKGYRFKNFFLDTQQKALYCDGSVVPLNPKGFECLLLLVENAGKIVTKDTFFREIWKNSFVEDGVLAVNIANLRKIFGEEKGSANFIETLARRGYRFKAEVFLEGNFPLNDDDILDSNLLIHVSRQPINYAPIHATNEPSVLQSPEVAFEENDLVDFVTDSPNNFRENSAIPNKNPLPVEEIKETAKPSFFGKISAYKWLILLLIGANVLTFGGYFVSKKYFNNRTVATAPDVVQIAILPFTNLNPNTETDYLSLSIPNDLGNRLAKHSTVSIVSPTQLQQTQHNQNGDLEEIAKQLKAEKIITGNYLVKDGKLQVNIVIKSAISDIKPVTNELNSPSIDYNEINKGFQQFLLTTLDLRRLDAIPKNKAEELKNPKAYSSYLQGMALTTIGQNDASISFLLTAVKEDPEYALAWEALGTVYYRKGTAGCGIECHNEAMKAIETAARLDPDNLRLKNQFAANLTENNRVDEAVILMREALKTNPNSRDVLNGLSYSYRYGGMLEESVEMIDKATRMSGSEFDSGAVVNSYLYQGRYDDFKNRLERNSERVYPRFFQGFLAYHLKDEETARAEFNYINKIESNHFLSKIGKAYIHSMDKKPEQALEILNTIKSDIFKNQFYDGEMIYKLAEAFAVNGDKKSALEMMKMSIESGFFCYPYFVRDPLMENIRQEPEFQSLLEKSRIKHLEFKEKFFPAKK